QTYDNGEVVSWIEEDPEAEFPAPVLPLAPAAEEEVSEEPSEEVSEEVTEEPSEAVSEEVGEEPLERASEEPSEAVSEEPSEEPTEEPGVVSAPELRERLELAAEQLQRGHILYNPPTRMRVGETERVEARITREFDEQLSQALRGSGEAQVAEILVSAEMEAQIIGNDFDIVQIGSRAQHLGDEGFEEWRWDVAPKSAGTRSLWVIVTAYLDDEPVEEVALEQVIVVEANVPHSLAMWFTANWDKIFGVLGITLAGAFGGVYSGMRFLVRRLSVVVGALSPTDCRLVLAAVARGLGRRGAHALARAAHVEPSSVDEGLDILLKGSPHGSRGHR
ncbi:MAG: hypothetical protein ACRD0K_16980, partial [Egibacteraceae bacterium]